NLARRGPLTGPPFATPAVSTSVIARNAASTCLVSRPPCCAAAMTSSRRFMGLPFLPSIVSTIGSLLLNRSLFDDHPVVHEDCESVGPPPVFIADGPCAAYVSAVSDEAVQPDWVELRRLRLPM